MDNRETREPSEPTIADLYHLYEHLKGQLNPQDRVQDLGLAKIAEDNSARVFEIVSSRFEASKTMNARYQLRRKLAMERFLKPVFRHLINQGIPKEEISADPPKPESET